MIFFAFVVIGILGGTTAALIKYASGDFSPFVLIATRLIFSVLLLLPFIIKYKIQAPRESWPLIILSSTLLSTNLFLFTIGVKYTSTFMSQLLYVPTGVIVAFLGYIVVREKLKPNQIAGLVITILGMSLLALGSLRNGDAKTIGEPFGNFLIIIGLFAWSAYFVVTRKIVKTVPVLSLSFLNLSIALIISLLFIPYELSRSTFTFSPDSLMQFSVFASALTSTAFIFLSQSFIKKTSAFIASLVTYVNPVSGAVWGFLLFGEKPTMVLFASTVIIFVGVFFATSYNYLRGNK